MLHKNPLIISPLTFQLIQQLQSLPELAGFYLVGGTSLALQLGHRNSIDIDLFSQNNFTAIDIENTLKGKHDFKVTVARNNTVLGVVDNIKTDFIKHDYPLINAPITEEGITYLGKEDIAATKIHAIIQGGRRLKDFIDIYFLLRYFTMEQLIAFFIKKYNYLNPLIALKAITYFDDIDESTDSPKLLQPLPLATIKKRILHAALKPYITF
jgi:hypothetical protein